MRDLLRSRPQDVLLHVTDSQWLLELPAMAVAGFVPLAPDDLVAAAAALGGPLVLHAHGTVPWVRQACGRLAAATGAPRLLTLHDVWFADPAVGAEELAARLAFARSADCCVAPSEFIVRRAQEVLGEGFACHWVPLASEPFDEPALGDPAPLPAAAQAARGEAGFDVAVIGAIGAHKGLGVLEALAPLLLPDVRVLVLGYTERQLRQGWTAGGSLWVHGIFSPEQLPALVRQYGVRLALFPPGMPESHCYALSDAWACGLPVLAPDHGALSERVRRHGGGVLYPPQTEAAALAHAVRSQLSAPAPRLFAPLPTMEAMMAAMNQHYHTLAPATVADAPAGPDAVDAVALQRLAQRHLDGRFFRLEVTDLQKEVERVSAALAHAEQRLAEVARERDAATAAHHHLSQRLARVPAWLRRLGGRLLR
ncbi:glycosyltransferase [Pseudorhodoferax sp.]|uniref:glycosyltransferase n=1 Tax=Pseudorhodoferax sp. TaxID=1993553 RepID=UPI002DD6B0C1|nr:glycosyltransferase [Pseudorhodoferax sp.]